MKALWRLLLAAMALPLIAAESTEHVPQPLKHFYRDYLVSNLSLSPNGKQLLGLKTIDGMTAVMVIDLEKGKAIFPSKTDNKEFKFNWVRWANNNRILMSLRFTSKRDLFSNTRFDETRLLAMDAKENAPLTNLVRPSSKQNNANWISQFQDNIIGTLPGDQDHVLVSVDREVVGLQSVYKVNVNNGDMELIQANRGDVRSWMADRQGVVRVGVGYDDRTRKTTIRVLPPNQEDWIRSWQYTVFDEPSIDPIGFGNDANELYLLADHQGRQALFKVDLSKPDLPRQLIHSDDEFDVEGHLIYSPAHQQVVGLYYTDSYEHNVFWHPLFQQLQTTIDERLPDTQNYLVSWSDDLKTIVVHSHSATIPGRYYLIKADAAEITRLADVLPELTEQILVAKQRKVFKARDGLELDGYLSLPKNFRGQPIPAILLPHGGPMAEDGAEFDRFSAFLVDRGYAVFQPNFRGSSGRGHEFMMKAVAGYGLAMQDDLDDAAQFLIDSKIADPKKMAIVGASYGGYAALMAAAKTPDRFQCAISFAGLSDLLRFRETLAEYALKNTYRTQFGNDKDQLANTSPARMVDKIKIPILLIHGDKDTSVPVAQSRRMADALKDADKTYRYIELEDGTHHLDYLPHRRQTFEAMAEFLAQYLPVM